MDNQIRELFRMLVTAIIIAAIISFLLTILGVRTEGSAIIWEFGRDSREVANTYRTSRTPDHFPERQRTNREEKHSQNKSSLSLVVLPDLSRAVNIPVSPMREFSGLKAETILQARKKAVSTSPVFGELPYTPDPRIFNIVDGRPWIGAYEISCHGIENNPNLGNGDSRESLAILNPEILMPITIADAKFNKRNYCSDVDYMIPKRMVYDSVSKTIVNYINYTDYKNKNGFLNIVLADQNARDLGYNYVYMDQQMNIRFKHPENNVSNNVIKTCSYYMNGGACGLPGGCNNIAPYVPGYEFCLNDLPAIAHFKLWRNRPESVDKKADLNYVIMFE